MQQMGQRSVSSVDIFLPVFYALLSGGRVNVLNRHKNTQLTALCNKNISAKQVSFENLCGDR